MSNALEFHSRAYTSAIKAMTSPEDYQSLRQNAGDVFTGAIAAGADSEAAEEVALYVHSRTELCHQIGHCGGLLIGANEFLKRRGIDD